MIRKAIGIMLLSLLLLSPSLLSCKAPGLNKDDSAAIYAAVVRQLYTIDHTFGDNPPNWPVVYLLRATDDRAGNPGRITEAKSSAIPEPVQTDIVPALSDLPSKFVWIDDRKEVIDERIMAVKDRGALVTFGNIYLQKDGSVQVPASIYFASTGADGTTYIVKKVRGIWQIYGNTGVSWIS